MVRNRYLLFLELILSFVVLSCTDGYETEPVEHFTLDYVFSKTDSAGVQAKRFLNDIYLNHLENGHNRVGGDYLDAASDDALSIDNDDPQVYQLVKGRYSANTRLADMEWGAYYRGIRKTNLVINNIDVVPFNLTYITANGEKKPLNVSMKAEARFLRAYMYFELVKRYGGVPLVGDEVFELGDNMQLPRNTFEQCIKYIVSELDDIKDDLRGLPMADAGDYAHVPTKEACLAMKSRVLLYAASPLFNEKTIDPGNELVGYASYDRNRWNIAAEAALDFINSYSKEKGGNIGLTADYRDVFLNFYDPNNNPELIFFRSVGKDNKDVEVKNGPLGFSGNALGNGRTNPTQNLVSSFPMKDGKMPGESKYVYDVNNPYKDRDPRLDYTVLHHGSNWLGKVLDTTVGGTNNPSGAQYSLTSYYMCKFMGKFEKDKTEYSGTNRVWVIYRYAEILLNYAEALNEALNEPNDEVYQALIALRKRAGIEPGDDEYYGLKQHMSQAEMRETIQNERRIEMAFEEQRYWDIRRWRLAEDIFQHPLKGLSILSSAGRTIYNETDVLTTTFETKRYLYPIPYSEVVKNDKMIQNPNWN